MRLTPNDNICEPAKPDATDWKSIKWYKVNRHVDSLQKRIYRASKNNDTLILLDKCILEPIVSKGTRLVLRREGRSNPPDLSDKSCFDTLSHQHILDKLGNFPLKGLIKKWLKAGYLENNVFHKTMAGTPQGGIISPLLANIALDGMEDALNIKYKQRKSKNGYTYVNKSKYAVIKYADDFVVICETLKDANEVYELLDDYLKDRGLTLAPDKTRITHIGDGVDFLGYNIRCYKGQDRDRVLVKASKDSVKSFKSKVKEIVRKCYPWNLEESITRLNYLINGTGNYWRIGSNSDLFKKMDNYIYEILLRQAKRWYPNKPVKWIVDKHFKESAHPKYHWKWTFTNPETGSQVDRMSWIKIKYSRCIKYKATPYDVEYEEYLNKRYSMTPFEYLYK